MATGYAGTTTPETIRDLWQTPDYAFTLLDREFNFALDAAASDKNTRVKTAYLTEKQDALKCDWGRHLCPFTPSRAVWLNPPYSDVGPWVEKAESECRRNNLIVVMLVPHTPDSAWWPYNASEIRVLRGVPNPRPGGRNYSGRIKFINADTGRPVSGNPKGSCYIIFAPGTLGNMTTKYINITDLYEAHDVWLASQKNEKGVVNG